MVVKRSKKAPASICYANPVVLLRRPMSELLSLQEKHRRVGLLLPRKALLKERRLHHESLFKNVELHAYRTLRLPFAFEWHVPGFGFFREAVRAYEEYDVVHAWAHFYLSTFFLALLKPFFPKKRLFLTMDSLPGYSFSAGPFLDCLFKVYTWTLGRIVYGAPDVITLYGKALLPHARRSGVNLKKVRVVPTGIIKHKVASRGEARKQLLRELGLSVKSRTRLVLYAGLLNPRKRVNDFLSVAAGFKRANARSETLFLIAGDGPSKKALEQRARDEALANVRFLGWREDLLSLMRAADVFLFPSSAEGLPGVVMEALYCETPVVTTRIPCTTDLVRHDKEGLLSSVGNVRRLAKNVQRVLKDKRLATRLARAGKERITTRYSWRRVKPLYDALYDEQTVQRGVAGRGRT